MTPSISRVRGLRVRPRTGRSETGMVTAETAVVLPVIVAVALGLAWVVVVAATHIQVVDASREAARLIARGDEEGEAIEAATRLAPTGTTFSVTHQDGLVRVDAEVTARLDAPLLRDVIRVDLSTSAVTTAEDR